MLDQSPIKISQFKGFYDRSVDLTDQPQILEEIPFGYAKEAKNVVFSERGVQNRTPLLYEADLGSDQINDIHIFGVNRLYSRGHVAKDLYVTVAGVPTLVSAAYSAHLAIVRRSFGIGTIYDTLVSAADTDAGGRNVLLVNSTTGAFRTAAAAAPGAAPVAATGGAGNVELGTHLITVAYETDSGFITKYRIPATVYVAPGGASINLTVIPIGPAGTIARHILATKVIHQFSGDTAAYEEFFVPGGKINDNVTVALTINFYDSELIRSADYLNDLESVLAGYVYLATYHNRAVYLKYDFGIVNGNNASIVLSLPGSFESISLVDGALSNSAFACAKNAFVYQDNLYVATGSSQTYLLKDNGGPPNSWEAVIVSSEITPLSATSNGRVPFPPSASIVNKLDYNIVENAAIIGAVEGIYAFRGNFDIRPLTWNIDRFWRAIVEHPGGPGGRDTDIRIRIDPDRKQIYVFGFVYAPNNPIHYIILIGDYSDGLNWNTIKWYYWETPIIISAGDFSFSLHLGQFGPYLYQIASAAAGGTDNRDEDHTSGVTVKVPIEVSYETGLLPFSEDLDLAQETKFRLNQRFESYGADPQQLIQFGAGIAGKYIPYTYVVGHPRIIDVPFNLPSNRETFKWFFSTQACATGYKAIELLDALVYYSVRAQAQGTK